VPENSKHYVNNIAKTIGSTDLINFCTPKPENQLFNLEFLEAFQYFYSTNIKVTRNFDIV